MKTIKSVLVYLLLSLWGYSSFAQTMPPAKVHIYRPKYYMSNLVPISIKINDFDVTKLKNNSKLEYLMYSEGTVIITAHLGLGTSNQTTLNIKAGETYYLSVLPTLFGVNINNSPSNPEVEWQKIPNTNLISMQENTSLPTMANRDEPTTAYAVETPATQTVIEVETVADIATNIPENSVKSDLSFALIIGNEDYVSFQTDLSKEMNVDFAHNDAKLFREYAIKTLGIPPRNITLLLDATYGQISQALSKINLIAKSTNGKATIYFYYAGHGLPDQNTKEPYIIPVDISSSNISSAINLKDVYAKLTEHPSKKVIVFLDACFTGGGREQGLLSARAVRVRPKENLLKGNMVVFSASSGEQNSLPYKQQKHGLFTYYLLKKLQETQGNINLKELSDYLTETVSLESILINSQEQTPRTNFSHDAEEQWQHWMLMER